MKNKLIKTSLLFMAVLTASASFAVPINNNPGIDAGQIDNYNVIDGRRYQARQKHEETKNPAYIDVNEATKKQAELLNTKQVAFKLKDIQITGNTVFPTYVLMRLVDFKIGQEVTINDLIMSANEITEYYQSKGYVSTVAYLPPQKVQNGKVEIKILEGKYGNVEINPGKWERSSYLNKNYLKFPLIAHLILKNGLEHFVVVKEIIKDTIYIMDPSVGNKKMSLEEFYENFTGHIIIAKPRCNIIKMNKGISISKLFLNILKKEKFLIIKIILTSIFLTLISILCSYYLKIGSNVLNNNYMFLKYAISIFCIIVILKVIMIYIREYYLNHLNNLVDVYLYPEFLHHIFYLPLKNIKSRSTGEIVTRINELGNIKSLFTEIFVTCFLDTLMMLISTIVLLTINKKLFMILGIFILIYFIYGFMISKVIYKKVLENINYQTDFNSMIVENIDGLESIKKS